MSIFYSAGRAISYPNTVDSPVDEINIGQLIAFPRIRE